MFGTFDSEKPIARKAEAADMIYTITFNPALDYTVSVDNFQMGMTNRTMEESVLPGGKGINVSVVLTNLGLANTALGFIAGFSGEEIKNEMIRRGCKTDFIALPQGMSRINVKLKSVEGTEINGMGPHIDKDNLEKLLQKIDKLEAGDVLVLAGTIPDSIENTIYREIMTRVLDKEILIVVDAIKDLLVNVLDKKPFLIKPNHHELGEIFGVIIETREEAIIYAKKLQEKGAVNVLVSMAGDGAILVTEQGEVLESDAPRGEVINAVGAGDSMVAGFLAGWLESNDYKKAFQMSLAAGSASAFSKELATREEVLSLMEQFTYPS